MNGLNKLESLTSDDVNDFKGFSNFSVFVKNNLNTPSQSKSVLGGNVSYDTFELISEIDDILFDCIVEEGEDVLDKAVKKMVKESNYEGNFDVECHYDVDDNEIHIKTDNVSNSFGSERSINSVKDTFLQTLSQTIMETLEEHDLADDFSASEVLDRLHEADMTKTSESYFGNTVEGTPKVRVPDSVSAKLDVLGMVESADDLMVDGSSVFKRLVDEQNMERSLTENFLVDISYEEGDCEAVLDIIGFDDKSALDIKGEITKIISELHAEYAKAISIELGDEDLDSQTISDELLKPELASDDDIKIQLKTNLPGTKLNQISLTFDKDNIIERIDDFFDSEVSLQTPLTGDAVTPYIVKAINNFGLENVSFAASEDIGAIEVVATYSDAVNFDAFTIQDIILTVDDTIRKVIAEETNQFLYKSQLEANRIVEKYVSKKYGSESRAITCAIKDTDLLMDKLPKGTSHNAYSLNHSSESKSLSLSVLPFTKAQVELSEDVKNDLDKITDISIRKGREKVLTAENSIDRLER